MVVVGIGDRWIYSDINLLFVVIVLLLIVVLLLLLLLVLGYANYC